MRGSTSLRVLGMELRWRAEALVAQVALVAVRPVVSAHAREPVAGVKALELLGAYLVDVDLAEVYVVYRAHRPVQIRGEHVGAQAVGRVVGEAYDLVEVVEGLNRQHGPEHLALHDLHLVRRPSEDRRLEPVSPLELLPLRAPAAEHHLGPLLDGPLHESLDLLELGPVHLRAHLHVIARGVTHAQRGSRLDESLDELVVDGALDVGALVAGADLAAVPEAGVNSVLDRGRDVGVLEDYERRLAAQLERDRGDVLRGGGEDLAPA